MTTTDIAMAPPTIHPNSSTSSRYQFLRRTRRNVGALIGLLLISIIIIMALFASAIAPYGFNEQQLVNAFQPPSFDHLLGTDELGRDLFSRIVFGARISLRIAVLVLGLATSIGSVLGALAGFYGGLIDEIVMRVADIFFAFPHFLLAMALVAALGPGLDNAMLAVAIAYWPRYARLVRGSKISLTPCPSPFGAGATGRSDVIAPIRWKVAPHRL